MEISVQAREPISHVQNMRACASWVLGFGVAVLGLTAAWAQAPANTASNLTTAPTALAPTSILSNSISVPLWRDLSSKEQQSLSPLVGIWDALSEGHRRKWIALAKNYPTLPPAEQTKLHSRMVEWASLKPIAKQLKTD